MSVDSMTNALSGYAGQQFALAGHKIKIAGEHADCGVYFVNAAAPSQRVQVSGHLADNTAGQWHIEAVTQFSGSGSTSLKAPGRYAVRLF
jgi:hypothetical protein